MAQKRMFDKGLLETDAFMDMPMPTKALYFLLGMEADDEGFVSPKRVMRLYGGNEDDLKVLMAKNFVIQFESGVIVITNWHENNYLDKNKVKETRYQAEKQLLSLSSNKYHRLNQSLPKVNQKLTQYRIEENSIEENSISSELSSQNKNIAEVIKMFEIVNPSYEKFYGNKTQRSACERLLKKWTIPQIRVIVNLLPEFNSKEYQKGKSITPLQMEDNLAYIKSFIDSKRQVNSKIAIIS